MKLLVVVAMLLTAPGASAANIAAMRTLYASMRPFVSGGCYVNYCDLDLGDGYAKAYWDDNLPRLTRIKAQFDPNNISRHAQSVPLGWDDGPAFNPVQSGTGIRSRRALTASGRQ